MPYAARTHVAACLAALLVLPAVASSPPAPFVANELADGVYLLRPANPSDPARVNSLLVLRQDGPLVVGAQPSPTAAAELITAIATIDPRAVRYLVLPHSHAEAAGGAAAFPRETLVIASRAFVEALADAQYDFAAETRGPAAPEPLPARPAPALVLETRAVLADGRNEVDLVPWDGRHSRGDLIVAVPRGSVLFAGALLFPDGDPWAGDAHLGRWIASLSHLMDEGRGRLVPLRGPAVGPQEVRDQRDALAWLRAQVALGLGDGLGPEALQARILGAPALAEHFAPEGRFLGLLVERAIGESLSEFRKHFGTAGP